jgi:NAD+ synthase
MDYKREVEDRAAWVNYLVKKTGTKGIVIGLSGGKDSAAVAAICAKAGVRVIGVNMPIKSNPDDNEYVKKLLSVFPEIEFKTINLSGTYNVLVTDAGLDETKDKVPCANIKARLRMTTLYAIASQKNLLVAGTDNLCEAYVGYFTKWGDGAFDFNLLGDLTVEEVVKIGIAAGVPKECAERVPTAGLWAGQTDEGEMGVTYKDIAHVARDEFDQVSSKAVLDKIEDMHNRTQHKRVDPPCYL